MSGDIRLIVQGDDFGMCHAINVGTMEAFHDGILTQASVMAPCPWFAEAAALAHGSGVPIGAHLTLTCEWDFLRWGPLTGAPSLAGDDGTFFRTVPEARAAVTIADAVHELSAQVARFAMEGLALGYLDFHMGEIVPEAYIETSRAAAIPYIRGPVEARRFASIAVLSGRDAAEKKPWMLDHIAGLTPGVHLLITHCGVAAAELSALTLPGSEAHRWAEEFRVSDLQVLTDPDIRTAISERGIELVSAADAFAA